LPDRYPVTLHPMIQLTRLNNSGFTVNADLIKFVEQNPDTVITLVNGEKILVQEPVGEVVSRVVEFRRRLVAGVATLGHTAPLVLTQSANPNTNESEG
jgi:flagellar protein FlbD